MADKNVSDSQSNNKVSSFLQNPRNNLIASATALGVVLILGFFAYRYFSNLPQQFGLNTVDEESTSVDENGDILSGLSTKREDENSNVAGTSTEMTWIANDYAEGDIKGDTYTVKSGDTLWEIAEAVYGNGADWTNILSANTADVGFLPSGQQALIVPGQVLVIPQAIQ